MMRAKTRGFSFVEMLAAMAFVAILVPVTMQAFILSSRTASVATGKRVAVELADRQLSEAILTQSWQDGAQSGDFGEDWPGYRWSLEEEAWELDTMQQLTLIVTFPVKGREYTVELAALVDETETTSEDE